MTADTLLQSVKAAKEYACARDDSGGAPRRDYSALYIMRLCKTGGLRAHALATARNLRFYASLAEALRGKRP